MYSICQLFSLPISWRSTPQLGHGRSSTRNSYYVCFDRKILEVGQSTPPLAPLHPPHLCSRFRFSEIFQVDGLLFQRPRKLQKHLGQLVHAQTIRPRTVRWPSCSAPVPAAVAGFQIQIVGPLPQLFGKRFLALLICADRLSSFASTSRSIAFNDAAVSGKLFTENSLVGTFI